MGPPPKTLDPEANRVVVQYLIDVFGFFWVICPICPRRALCNPKLAPGLCCFCQVRMIDPRPSSAVVN